MTHSDHDAELDRIFGPLGAPLLASDTRLDPQPTLVQPEPADDDSASDEDDVWGTCCDGPGCEECQPDRHESHYLKYIAEQSPSLLEIIAALQGLAEHLSSRHQQGWELTQPVDNGHVFLHLPVEQSTAPS